MELIQKKPIDHKTGDEDVGSEEKFVEQTEETKPGMTS